MKDILSIVLNLICDWFGAVMGQGLIRKRILEIFHYHFKLIIAPEVSIPSHAPPFYVSISQTSAQSCLRLRRRTFRR